MAGDSEPQRDTVYELRAVRSLAEIGAENWRALAGADPFLSWDYLSALHETRCASTEKGWTPHFITLWDGDRLEAAMPLYVKTHSRGEYVFDWAWADAYERNGFDYYPKLLSAIPFTPATGARLLARNEQARFTLAHNLQRYAKAQPASSLHVLFPHADDAKLLASAGFLMRTGVQFHWFNAGYGDFGDFLATLTHDKRKRIRQERRKVGEAGIEFRRLRGSEIGPQDWAFFYRCYCHTYRAHMSSPYLNLAFFERLGAAMPENMLLSLAVRGSERVGASLCVYNGQALWGRYWGALEFVSCLHFEACYYQPIEFCIANKIPLFEGGAQGEHKLARGFLPVATHSAHWLKQPEFSDAVERFLESETSGITSYIDELNEHAPYRQQP
jgi:uncharacterized protein